MQICLIGTPDFAVPVFECLNEKHTIVSVITAPDKPSGRGKKINNSPVKLFAIENKIPLLQPQNLKDKAFLEKYYSTKPEINVVVAFRMLPKQVFAYPKFGSINLHASFLPQYRGAAPINWAIINGENQTGLTTFLLDKKIDTGGILLQEKIKMSSRETAGTLYAKMLAIGPKLVSDTLKGIKNGHLKPVKQKISHQLAPAPKILKADMQIDWTNSLSQIDRFIRGLSPYPGAFLMVKDTEKNTVFQLKLYDACPVFKHFGNPGIFIIKNGHLYVTHAQGALQILVLQQESRKKLKVADFLLGTTIKGWIVAAIQSSKT